MSIPITSTLGVPPLPSLLDKNVDEYNKSPPEQGKRTPTSAKSLSGLVKSKRAKATPKTADLLRNVRRKSCRKKDSVGAQNTVTVVTPSSGRKNLQLQYTKKCSDW